MGRKTKTKAQAKTKAKAKARAKARSDKKARSRARFTETREPREATREPREATRDPWANPPADPYADPGFAALLRGRLREEGLLEGGCLVSRRARQGLGAPAEQAPAEHLTPQPSNSPEELVRGARALTDARAAVQLALAVTNATVWLWEQAHSDPAPLQITDLVQDMTCEGYPLSGASDCAERWLGYEELEQAVADAQRALDSLDAASPARARSGGLIALRLGQAALLADSGESAEAIQRAADALELALGALTPGERPMLFEQIEEAYVEDSAYGEGDFEGALFAKGSLFGQGVTVATETETEAPTQSRQPAPAALLSGGLGLGCGCDCEPLR